MAREGLVNFKGYPKAILDIDFNFQRAIRGLIIDEKRGNLIKLSLYGRIKRASHGTQLMDARTRQQVYGGKILDPGEKFFTPIDTSFSLSHGVLFAHLVDLRDKNPKLIRPTRRWPMMFLEMIDLIHRDHSLKSYVTERMHQYFIQDREIPRTLERLKRSGKTLFVVTNSDYRYTQKLLDYTMMPFLREHTHWKDLFDIIVTFSGKPGFLPVGSDSQGQSPNRAAGEHGGGVDGRDFSRGQCPRFAALFGPCR